MVEPVLFLRRLRTWSALGAAAVGLLYAAVVWRTGAHLSADSKTYATWADTLIAEHFDYRAYLSATHFVVPPVLYVVWITTVALCKVALGAAWPAGILALNCVSATAVLYGLASGTGRLTRSPVAAFAAAALFVASIDALLFLSYALSDVLFMGLAAGVLLLGLSVASGAAPETRERRLLAGTALVVVACVFRPTGPPLVLFWLGAVWLALGRGLRARHAWAAVGVLALAGAAGVVLEAAMMQDPAGWARVGGQSEWMRQLSAEARLGIVVFDRPATFLPEPHSLVDFVRLTLTKWAYYFAPWLTGYSRVHTLADAGFFGATYLLSLVAVWRSPRWRLTSLLVVYIGAFSLFHAVQQIDFDLRYRLPVLPALCVLAALGVEAVAGRGAARGGPRESDPGTPSR